MNHAVNDFDTASASNAARGAFSAGFNGAELHGITSHFGHVDRVVEDNDATVANHTSSRGKGFVIQRGVELGLGQISSQRPTHLNRTDGPTGGRTSAELIKHLAQRDAEGLLDQSAPLDVARQLERERAPGSPRTETSVKGAAFVHDQRHGSQGHDVVDEGRPSPQPGQRRNWRLRAHHAALALKALQHGGFLTANVGTRPAADVQLESLAGAQKVRSQISGLVGVLDGGEQNAQGVRILGAQIDVAFGGSDSQAGNDHAFDEHEGVSLKDHPIREGARIAFVGVAHDVLLLGAGIENGLPLDAGRKRRAAAPAQARLGNLFDEISGFSLKCRTQPTSPAVGFVVGDAERIDDANAAKGEPLLSGEIGNGFGGTESQTMRAPLKELGIEQRRDIVRFDRSVADAPLGGDDFNEGFEPKQAARAIANQADGNAAFGGDPGDGLRRGVGTEANRGRIVGDVDGDTHGFPPAVVRNSWIQRSSFSEVTRPRTSPSTSTEGAQAQFPRQ